MRRQTQRRAGKCKTRTKLDFCIFRGFAGCGVQADGGWAIRVVKPCAPQLNAAARVAFWSRFFEHPRYDTGPSRIHGPFVQQGAADATAGWKVQNSNQGPRRAARVSGRRSGIPLVSFCPELMSRRFHLRPFSIATKTAFSLGMSCYPHRNSSRSTHPHLRCTAAVCGRRERLGRWRCR